MSHFRFSAPVFLFFSKLLNETSLTRKTSPMTSTNVGINTKIKTAGNDASPSQLTWDHLRSTKIDFSIVTI